MVNEEDNVVGSGGLFLNFWPIFGIKIWAKINIWGINLFCFIRLKLFR